MAARYGSIVWASVALIDYVVWQRFGIINVAAKTGNHQINSQPVILRFFHIKFGLFSAREIQELTAAGFVEFCRRNMEFLAIVFSFFLYSYLQYKII